MVLQRYRLPCTHGNLQKAIYWILTMPKVAYLATGTIGIVNWLRTAFPICMPGFQVGEFSNIFITRLFILELKGLRMIFMSVSRPSFSTTKVKKPFRPGAQDASGTK
jgi:hypothetical protein